MIQNIRSMPQLCALMLGTYAVPSVAQGQYTPPPPGDYTVHDVELQFEKLAIHGDALGFYMGPNGGDPDQCRHFQGINRINAADGTPYLITSRSGVRSFTGCDGPNEPSVLLSVRMGSRPKHGGRMRSNRLSINSDWSSTAPPSSDTGTTAIILDGAPGGWPEWLHSGDGQIVDGVLACPMEQKTGNDDIGSIMLIDYANPEDPQFLYEKVFPFKLGVLAMTKDPGTGKYLIAVTGGNSQFIQFYESDTDDLRTTTDLILIDTWSLAIDGNFTVQSKWENWQNLDFIRESNGALYLFTADNTAHPDSGPDWTRLFEVNVTGVGIDSEFDLEYVDEKQINIADMGNAAAGSGVYIDPSGNLLAYYIEHDNDGPAGTVKTSEARSHDVGQFGVGPSSDLWIELYQDSVGWDDASPDRSHMLDAIDITEENWFNLNEESGWGDDADSVRWRAPLGHEVWFFSGTNLSGSILRRTGTGEVDWIDNLDNVGFGDTIESIFAGAYPSRLSEDLISNLNLLKSIAGAYNGGLRLYIDPGSHSVGANTLIEPPNDKSLRLIPADNFGQTFISP